MKILLGMSGGLDSSYAAYLLKNMGHTVDGAVLLMSEHTDTASALESAESAGIKLNIIDCRDRFKQHVIQNLIDEYSKGRTPNPCVMCNRYVKIQLLYEYAVENGYDKFATGHYADVKNTDDRYYIECADDISKDQSYVLWQLTQEQLSMFYMPLAGLSKSYIREEAKKLSIAAADRGESQEICFIPDKDYAGYIKKISGDFPTGNFIDVNGNVLGKHKGIIHYTIGQRKGLEISFGHPMFVIKINADDNTVMLAEAGNEFADTLEADSLVFQHLNPDVTEFQSDVKIRYAAKPVKAYTKITDGIAYVKFESPARAVTPGQSIVFYRDGKILCGGFIRN
jgi:tRNA (5-methylaminomethyl-2-thiouridylate)-methyltransferase